MLASLALARPAAASLPDSSSVAYLAAARPRFPFAPQGAATAERTDRHRRPRRPSENTLYWTLALTKQSPNGPPEVPRNDYNLGNPSQNSSCQYKLPLALVPPLPQTLIIAASNESSAQFVWGSGGGAASGANEVKQSHQSDLPSTQEKKKKKKEMTTTERRCCLDKSYSE